MKKRDALATALVLAGLVAAAAYLAPDQKRAVGIAEVIDGDTLLLEGHHIRLSGIDAPELRQTCLADAAPYPCGEAARKALADIVQSSVVACRISGRDRYGRDLATCEAGGEDVGAALVSRGFALAYGRYMTEEADARRKRLEIWSGSFERPSEWRKAHSDQRRG